MGTSWFRDGIYWTLHLSAGGHLHRGSICLNLFKAYDDDIDWTFKSKSLGIDIKLGSDLETSKRQAVRLAKETLERILNVIGDELDCELPERFLIDQS